MIGKAFGSLIVDAEPERHVADLDEDEVTLAVDAARLALRNAGASVDAVGRLEVGAVDDGPALPPWVAHVQAALGMRNAQLAGLGPMPPQPGTLRVEVESARRNHDRQAHATAQLGMVAGSPGPGGPFVEPFVQRRAVPIGYAQRIVEAEARWLAQVPMGAYVSRATWDATLEARYRLLASFCSSCRAARHPPVDPCVRCGGTTTTRAFDEGTIHTWTTIAKGGGPTEFDELQALGGDYAVAVVDLAPGLRVAGMLTHADPSSLRIGQRVRAVLRRIYAQEGAWRYGTKFQPLDDVMDR